MLYRSRGRSEERRVGKECRARWARYQAEDGIRDIGVTGVQTCALPIFATGATGYVLRASFGTAGSEMALKIPILKTTTGAAALNETMAEATTLLELSGQSKYVVQIKGKIGRASCRERV